MFAFKPPSTCCFIAKGSFHIVDVSALSYYAAGAARGESEEGCDADRVVHAPPPQPCDESRPRHARHAPRGHDEAKGKQTATTLVTHLAFK